MVIPFPKTFVMAVAASVTATVLAATDSVAKESAWTPEMVAAIFLGVTGLFTALGNMYFTNRATKAQRELVGTVKGVHNAVNGTNTTLVETVARLSERIAEITKDPADRVIADAAEVAAADKRALTAHDLKSAEAKEKE